jgi:dephospho-CoA kinase
MIKIGITGSFASGKSELLKHLAKEGYPVFNCDKSVHALYQDREVQKQVLKILPEVGVFDKTKIASLIYADDLRRNKLEELMHPLVASQMDKFLKKHSIYSKIVFLEIPLLFEAKWENYFDYIIALHCTKSLRQERALGRGISAEMFEAIDKSQLPESTKKDLADFSIDTACDFDKVTSDCKKIIQLII